MRLFSALAVGAAAAFGVVADSYAETWRGLEVRPENRCSEYDRKADYPYSQSVELDIIASIGKIYGPYTATCFASRYDTDIEHIVATSEAHDSGLCAADRATRKRFASDLRNLTLASPRVNRHQKKDKDAADWMPQLNRCWFAARVVEVRRAYGLTIDAREAVALEQELSNCDSTEMVIYACAEGTAQTSASSSQGSGKSDSEVLAMYDDNGNGRITCSEARRHKIAPVSRNHPAYQFMRDGDGDGVVCE